MKLEIELDINAEEPYKDDDVVRYILHRGEILSKIHELNMDLRSRVKHDNETMGGTVIKDEGDLCDYIRQELYEILGMLGRE